MQALFNPASWAPVILAWSFLLLLPFSRSSELPMFIMAILGRVLIWRHGKQATWQGGAKTFSLLFLCIWVPIALSVPDSLWFKKSFSTMLSYPRIYLAGIYLIWMLREDLARQRVLKLSAWLLLFWVVDALVQAVVGYDLLGYAYPDRLNGLFGPKNWKLGLTLAMLSPNTLAGDFLFMVAAVAGLAAVMNANPGLFQALQWFGAAYLCWMGLQLQRVRVASDAATPEPRNPAEACFRQAFAVSITNPKVVLFFVAFFPVFLRPDSSRLTLAAMMVPVTVISFLYQAGLVLAGNSIARKLEALPLARRIATRLAGVALIGFGIKLASSNR